MNCPNCQAQVLPDDIFCANCGYNLSSTAGAAPIKPEPPSESVAAAPVQPAAEAPPSAPQRLTGLALENVYSPIFNVNSLPPEQREEFKRHLIIMDFPVAALIILHFVTFGIFTFSYLGLKHSQLPRIKMDDFFAGRGLGFLLIPFFSLYWIFVFWLRLTDRINFQFRLRNRPDPIPKGLVLATVIVGIIPYVNYIALLILYPIIAGLIQSACNALARERDEERFPSHLWRRY